MQSLSRPLAALIALGTALSLTPLGRADDQTTIRQAAAPANTYRAKEVLGSKVNIDNNLAIGLVDDIVFSDDGMIEYLIVNNQSKLVTVPWEAAKFNFEKRTAVIQISQEKFREIPTYTVETYPSFATPNYRVQTYKYYGLTPHERRALRRGVNP